VADYSRHDTAILSIAHGLAEVGVLVEILWNAADTEFADPTKFGRLRDCKASNIMDLIVKK
jgi:hypothetical protein